MKCTIYIVLLLLLISIIFAQLQETSSRVQCGENEKYTCGTTCVETCTYKPTICTMMCKFGCFCNDGYVRESNETTSRCIKREDCPVFDDTKICPENEEYSTCGTACPPTCSDLRYPLPKPHKSCILMCQTGCFCKKGYYRSENNKCVAPEQCCGVNEEYKTCGSACVDTCDGKSEDCTKQCVRGCFCDGDDYVRQGNNTDSPCIHRDNCSKNV